VAKTYSLEFTKKARDGLNKIHPTQRDRVLSALELLSVNPFVSKAVRLSGTDSMRVRVGNYRIVYQVFESTLLIQVVNISHRRDVYRNL
jgi:mRNA interferase RelE/StbE